MFGRQSVVTCLSHHPSPQLVLRRVLDVVPPGCCCGPHIFHHSLNILCSTLIVLFILPHQKGVIGDQIVGLPVRRWVGIWIIPKTTQHRSDLVYVVADVIGDKLCPPAECLKVDWLDYLICRFLNPGNTYVDKQKLHPPLPVSTDFISIPTLCHKVVSIPISSR